jgi:hypothetical protein
MSLFRKKKISQEIPITPEEVNRRIPDVPEILEWSRKKHLIIDGPEFWGIHHIFIADDLKHIIFCLKADYTTHVYIGIPTHAQEWRKYNEEIEMEISKSLNQDELEWKIYHDYVLYRGKMLPPKEIPEEPYWGKVIDVRTWEQKLSDNWIGATIKYLYTL